MNRDDCFHWKFTRMACELGQECPHQAEECASFLSREEAVKQNPCLSCRWRRGRCLVPAEHEPAPTPDDPGNCPMHTDRPGDEPGRRSHMNSHPGGHGHSSQAAYLANPYGRLPRR